jgi:hypothetical protein
MKKFIVCLAMLAFVGYAQADTLVGSFEGVNDGWADHVATAATGWSATVYVDDPAINPSQYSFSSDWSTVGNQSLKTNVTGWAFNIRRDVRDVFWQNNTIEFDVACVAQEGSTATWAQVERITGSFQTNGNWDMTGTNFGVGLDGETVHVSYNYGAYKNATYASATDAYGSFMFAYNADAPVALYIDNIMFTPEPATISLLGLGGLALLRRKK